jgi:hypothetical protein
MQSAPMQTDDDEPGQRPVLRWVAVIVVVVAILVVGALFLVRGGVGPASSSSPQAVDAPTAVPTLDFFRGKSYPTATPLP